MCLLKMRSFTGSGPSIPNEAAQTDGLMNSKLAKWEAKLYQILHEVDDHLEVKYGNFLPLHPSRPEQGTAANPQYDGLFRLTASFSAGYGSELGAGYIFRVEIVTLSKIPSAQREKIEDEAADLMRQGLERAFPDRHMAVARDGSVYKIYGDLTLNGI